MVRIGLEIHQQLATGKLFCNCPSKLFEEIPRNSLRIFRYFKSRRGEAAGEDVAAKLEEKRVKGVVYIAPLDATCAVEWDEEPPHMPNREALEEALKAAMLFNAKIVDEIHFMRKTIIDGSVVSGFQRTALIATHGSIKGVEIETICLEEDSARPLGTDDAGHKIFVLDRLGIPLLEITTAPVIETGRKAMEVALAIGETLRMLKVRRGLGTIRQDINVSVPGGARVEIKGVQELELIPKIVDYEVMRQKKLLQLQSRIKELRFSEIKEVTTVFSSTSSRILKGKRVYAMALYGGGGLFAERLNPSKTLGNEIAGFVKALGFKGFIHTDEDLQRYGITGEELSSLLAVFNATKKDLIILAAGNPGVLEKVIERLQQFSSGVPPETRKALPDGSTQYLRPLPGKARLYPETDIPPVKPFKVERPESPEERFKRLSSIIGSRYARAVMFYPEYEEFLHLGGDILAAKYLVEVRPALRRFKVQEDLTAVKEVLSLIRWGKIAEDALFDAVLKKLRGEEVAAGRLSRKELEELVRKIARERINYILSSENPEKGIMGVVMKEVKGRAPGREVFEVVKKIISEIKRQ